MTRTTKSLLFKGAAIVLDVGAPFAATLSQFPIWIEKSSAATISGLFVILAFLSCLPFLKHIKTFFKSPSVWVIWVLLFVLLFALKNIINEMLIVCFTGMLANIIGAFLYHIGRSYDDKKGGGDTG